MSKIMEDTLTQLESNAGCTVSPTSSGMASNGVRLQKGQIWIVEAIFKAHPCIEASSVTLQIFGGPCKVTLGIEDFIQFFYGSPIGIAPIQTKMNFTQNSLRTQPMQITLR